MLRQEDLLDVADVTTGLREMILQRGLKLVVLNLRDELGQYLVSQLTLDVQDVAELMKKQFAGARDLGHGSLLRIR